MSAGPDVAPEVSVVVISFNDADRLPRAIRSVQAQTLRNLEIIVVDDASTDHTASVVRALAEQDARIRYERLPENSGGCSAPRNRGLELARAEWVMFCDSDDEYERHACKNLLLAAERLDADVVCGAAQRIITGGDRERRWRPEVHEVERVADGIEQFPELLYDTISVNKIYRRRLLLEQGIRFPEGLLFEDQLFTLEAFAAARRVAAIPETVYYWYVDRQTRELSITQRRREDRNVSSRVEINRRMDAFLAQRGLAGIRRIKDVKFLRHDLYLYLCSTLEADDESAQVLIDRLAPYVAELDPALAWELRPALRVAVYHLLVNDLEGVRAAMQYVKWASVVATPIVTDGGRDRWGCEHLAAGPAVGGIDAAQWLDVTDLHIPLIPFTQRRYVHMLDELTVDGDRLTVVGHSFDYDGSLQAADRIEVRISMGGAWTAMSLPAAWESVDGRVRRWRASGALTLHSDAVLGMRDRGSVGLAVITGDHVNVTSLRAREEDAPQARLPFPGRLESTGADTLQFGQQAVGPYGSGAVGWRATRVSERRTRAAARQARRRRGRVGRRWREYSDLFRRDVWTPLLQRIGVLLGRQRIALLEADGGRTAAGPVAAVGRGLAERGIAPVWVVRGSSTDVPDGARTVERLSLRHHWLAARARYWVDDGTASLALRKSAATTAALVSSGVPIHRLGLDDPEVLLSRSGARDVTRRGRRTDVMITASRYDTDIRRRAWAVAGAAVEAGIVQADHPWRVRAGGADAVRQLRVRLDLPVDRPIVLYLPTLRRPGGELSLLDLDAWASAVGDRCYLVLHPHPLEDVTVSTRLRFAVRHAGGDVELSDLLAAADLVISDYSSLIGAAVLLGLPVIRFQPDREEYVQRTRGVYAGPGEAGPMEQHLDGLLDQVRGWLDDPQRWWAAYEPAYRDFAVDRCGPADGNAVMRAVDALLEAAR